MGCLGVKCPPAVCPLCYFPLNHSTRFNEIRCVSYSHEWGCYGKLLLTPAPWGPREGSKGQNHLISITMSISKILYQTLCVFSQMKDTNHIRRDFYSVAWVMLQGWDFWALWGPRWSFFFKQGHVAYQIDRDDKQNRMKVKILSLGQTSDLEVRSKVKYHYISVTMSISKIFIPNFGRVLTNERNKTYQTGFLFCRLVHALGVELWGTGGA